MLNKEQQEEIGRCAVDFPYFCENYVQINTYQNHKQVLIPFKLWDYQVRLADHVESNRFTIFSKFRQGGFTSELAIYGMWRCLFRLDQSILWNSQSDYQARLVCGIVKDALDNIPDWMKGTVMKMTNVNQKVFPETDSKMYFHTTEAACAKAATLLIIDEASAISNMESHWKAMWPVLSTGGSCVLMSTIHKEDWFWEKLVDAKLGMNQFSVYQCDYKERPDFRDLVWEQQMKNQLGATGWQTEMEQQVLFADEKPIVKKKSENKWRTIYDESESSYNEGESYGSS